MVDGEIRADDEHPDMVSPRSSAASGYPAVVHESWAYLGPEGTFTEQAALSLRDRSTATVDLVPVISVPAALEAVRGGTAAAAVVPLENSVEGIVALTQDELIHGAPLVIAGEAYVPIRFDLLVRQGFAATDIRTIGSHPHGHAQVRDHLAQHFPDAEAVVTTSTAAAAAQVAAGELDAAACAPVAGRHHGLVSVAQDIGAGSAPITRFVQLRAAEHRPPATGADRTSLVVTVPNVPGSLVGLLTEIAERGINLTRIESRPTRELMGEYLFILDADGHADDEPMRELIATLQGRGVLLRFLGSYPRGH